VPVAGLHVHPRAEGPAGSRHYYHLNIVIVLGVLDGLGPLREHGGREGVHGLGPVHGDGGDTVFLGAPPSNWLLVLL